MIKKETLSLEQEIAAEPTLNVWVQANAGTGKTSVLTARLLRILFRGDEPIGGILCLTYTNAAAGEMRNRILAALRGWAMATDAELRELLIGVSINKAPTDDIAHARSIFFKYIDNPDILKIKTIHGFCEEVLHRFPTEAGISPSWSLISDAPQRVLLNEALNNLINSPTNDARTVSAFNYIVGVMSEYKLDDLLTNIEQQYKNFFIVNDFDNYRNYFIETIEKFLKQNIEKNTKKDVEKLKNILNLARAEKKPTAALENLILLTEKYIDGAIDFEEYKFAYLTKTTKKPIARGLNYEYLTDEKERVLTENANQINRQLYMSTVALFDLSAAFAKKYAELKQSHNVLDFEDLILYTHRLFSNPENMGWVLSQMDFSLSHILVDEAQDTGPLQWELLQMLSGDFFAEGERANLPRSLFVVGDTKQSIYGFQGADPKAFASSRQQIAAQIKNNARQIREVPLTQSFRSVEPILKTVDMFFGDATVAGRTGFVNNPHKCFRVGQPGLVEMHGIVTPGDKETAIARKEYIRGIGAKIEQLLAGGKYKPHDIMILVQNRNPFAVPMANELKRRGIAVAGSDRVVLPNFPVIRDLMNLLRFCINPADDYSLACVFKSPMFAMNESAVYEICAMRNSENARRKNAVQDFIPTSVFEILKITHPDVFGILNDFMEKSHSFGPYSFFTYVLNSYGIRKKFIATLGQQIIDPLEEFITICLAYERTRPGTLRHFIKWFITGNSEIKRDMDSGAGVRIVTIHGSKGLQAPVVFLIDTTAMPKPRYIYNLPDEHMPIWIWVSNTPSGSSTEFEEMRTDATNKDIEESYRLLYVAMTRARDELYIYGFTSNNAAPDLSWHNMLWNTLSEKVGVSDNIIRISNYDE